MYNLSWFDLQRIYNGDSSTKMVDGWRGLCCSSLFHTTFGYNKDKHFPSSGSHEDEQKVQAHCSSLECCSIWIVVLKLQCFEFRRL